MALFALTTAGRVGLIVAGGLVLWLGSAAMVAEYGRGRGYGWWPLFVSALFLGFPLVLLAVTIGSGPIHYPLTKRSTPGDDDTV